MLARALAAGARAAEGSAAGGAGGDAAGSAGVADLPGFLAAYYRHVPAEELTGRPPADVLGVAVAHRRLAAHRPVGQVNLAVRVPDTAGWPGPYTVVEIVTDDMPFLVDSVAAELSRHGLGIHLVVHPQLVVVRSGLGDLLRVDPDADPDHPGDDELVESWMHLEIDRVDDPDRLDRLAADLRRVLTDVREAVEDWRRMRATALAVADDLVDGTAPVPEAERAEAADLLRWLADDHFTFLGYREYELVAAERDPAIRVVPGTGLGILRAESRTVRRLADMPPQVRAKALEPRLLIVTKANSRSTVHRPVYLDYVGIRRFDAAGRVIGERRFLGLLSSAAYLDSVRRLPLVRRKVAEVLHRSGLSPRSHSGKDLLAILETYPRDELFQVDSEALYQIVMGVLRLQERRQLRLFLRRDDYGRFWSCLVYLPRDRYNTAVRERIQQILLDRLGGTAVDYTARVTESVLARLHVVVRTPSGAPGEVAAADLQGELAAATRTWEEDLADAVRATVGEQLAAGVLARYGSAFPEAYKEDFPATTGVADLRRLEMLDDPDDPANREGPGDVNDIALSLYRPPGAHPDQRRFKVYRAGEAMAVSDVLPLLHSLGVRVVDERPYGLQLGDGRKVWIYDFGLEHVFDRAAPERVGENFQNAFAAVWRGDCEVDGFNALVLAAGLTWRQVVVLRALAKYLRQAGTPYTQDYIENACLANASIARELVKLFETRFDPEGPADRSERTRRADELVQRLHGELDAVASLDQDRILRSLLRLVLAALRTTYSQRGPDGRPKPYLSIKLDPRAVPDLPQPRPKFEIWVYAPRFEGVHLRFGAVARGGLRWSDRPQDFRTEVLGLVKAQTVKNAVIVPVGAKGGFVVKRPPAGGGRDAVQAEGVACYRMFVRGLLDVTDNLVDGVAVPPPAVVRHDADDPYLVVAADKGTATFSDVANEIATGYGFWLGDAFASGGSAGYDHKRIGITARGAWESVKRHFRELGHDVSREDFTVVGIGDMSGDVFGNGMLLSRHIRLVAAFDHRHVFLDPDPDPAVSFAERRRLFDLPRSSWDDYQRTALSAGGGVYPRTAKSVPVSAPVRRALGIPDDVEALAPADLIRAILLAPVDLLWNGGVGTYVKATDESHADVGDKANDAVRVDAARLSCRVVAEGGNLGFTQRGRVEYALAGGRINTDAIDNSAGVDTSDHEVNIKILLDQAVRAGALSRGERNQLLADMTDEVAELVLRHNYDQNQALGAAAYQARAMLNVHVRLIAALEAEGALDRELEALPGAKQLAARADAGLGLTRPELAVLLAYVKLTLEQRILHSELPDDEWLVDVLVDYFPHPLRSRFRDRMATHPLRREIIATLVVNDLVNRAGTTFAFRAQEETGAAPDDVVRAYLVAREVFGLRQVWGAIEDLDDRVPAKVQVLLLLEGRRLLDRSARWVLQNRRHPVDVAAEVGRFAAGVAELAPCLPTLLVGAERQRLGELAAGFAREGAPEDLAVRCASLLYSFPLLDVVQIATSCGEPLREVAAVYFGLSERFRGDELLERISALPRADRWQALARSALRYDLYAALAELTAEVLDGSPPGDPAAARIAAWEQGNASTLSRLANSLGELPDGADLATLSVVLRQLRTMVRASASPAR